MAHGWSGSEAKNPKDLDSIVCLVLVNNVDKTVAIDGNGPYIGMKVSKGNIARHNMHFLLTL
jgi:hypothetical protein